MNEMDAPERRDTFLNRADELNYLNDWISYYRAGNALNLVDALRSIDRFEQLLGLGERDDGSLVLQDHWALLHEVKGEFSAAIENRNREVELIKTLFDLGGPVGSVDYSFLVKTMKLLAHDYLANGDRSRYLAIVEEIQGLEGPEFQSRCPSPANV